MMKFDHKQRRPLRIIWATLLALSSASLVAAVAVADSQAAAEELHPPAVANDDDDLATSASEFRVDDVFRAGEKRRGGGGLESQLDAPRLRRSAASGRWAKTNLQVWGKRQNAADTPRTWAKNNFKIWGKRSGSPVFYDDDDVDDMTSAAAAVESGIKNRGGGGGKQEEVLRLLRSLLFLSSPRRKQPIVVAGQIPPPPPSSLDAAATPLQLQHRRPAFFVERPVSAAESAEASSTYDAVSKRDTKDDDMAGVPDWGKQGWASNNVRIWG